MTPLKFIRLKFMKNILNHDYIPTLQLQGNAVFQSRHQSSYTVEIDEHKSKIFFSREAQMLMKQLTGFDLDKIYRRRCVGDKIMDPNVKFLTTNQLKQIQAKSIKQAYQLLQMPPLVPVKKVEVEVLDEVPEMIGFSFAKYVFTDISYGIPDNQRIIVVREPNGVLRKAFPDERHRMCQLYFPRDGRSYKTPKMFEPENLNRLLQQGEYEFILDRACCQFEPDYKEFHEVTFNTYRKINEEKAFNKLRSTRYFGPMAFYLCLTKNIDALLEENLQTERLEDAVSLVKLYQLVNPDCKVSSSNLDPNMNKIEYLRAFIEAEIPNRDHLLQILDTYWESNKRIVDNTNR